VLIEIESSPPLQAEMLFYTNTGVSTMRRLLVTGLSIAGLSLSLAVTGCGDGGQEGVPTDTTPGVPIDSVKTQMAPVKSPPKGSPTGEATPETKK
jgi:hypothetical protein